MLIINDNVLHQTTGMVGKVIGYGHQIINNAYLPTLKVLISKTNPINQAHPIVEDLVSSWMPME